MFQDKRGDEMRLFTLNEAYARIGGFGRFQLLALILLTIIRNSGFACVYGYAMATEVPKYLCKLGDGDKAAWERCSRQLICEKTGSAGFEYKYDRGEEEFFENWFTALDLTCKTPQ